VLPCSSVAKTPESAAEPEPRRTRRPRGEPRRLLLEAAGEVFNERGYASSTTREISDRAEVTETLLFRYFGNKAGLFAEAMVKPFAELVDWQLEQPHVVPKSGQEAIDLSRRFIGELYDLFRTHRALAALLFLGDVATESELSASGVLDGVREQVERLTEYTEERLRMSGVEVARHDITIRAALAMIAGTATLGAWYYGTRRPSRAAIVDELNAWVMDHYAGIATRATPSRRKPSAAARS
jgi:AcrR family transcriptional regulator